LLNNDIHDNGTSGKWRRYIGPVCDARLIPSLSLGPSGLGPQRSDHGLRVLDPMAVPSVGKTATSRSASKPPLNNNNSRQYILPAPDPVQGRAGNPPREVRLPARSTGGMRGAQYIMGARCTLSVHVYCSKCTKNNSIAHHQYRTSHGYSNFPWGISCLTPN